MNTIFLRLPVVATALLFTAFLYGQRDTLVCVPLPGQEMPVLRAQKSIMAAKQRLPTPDFSCFAGITVDGQIVSRPPNSVGLSGFTVKVQYEGCPEGRVTETRLATSDSSGHFQLCGVRSDCNAYSIVPISPRDNIKKGINTWDLVQYTRHILDVRPFADPYTILAADVNRSGTITALDIMNLRKIIVGVTDTLQNRVQTWRFFDADEVFPYPQNPFNHATQEVIAVKKPFFAKNTVRFIACKMGDVDNSATPNNRPSPLPETYLSWDMAPAKSAKTFTVPVVYSGETAVTALQFGLQFNPALMTLVGPTAGDVPGINDSFFGLDKTDEGLIRFSWNAMDLDQTPVVPGAVLFYLTFERTANEALRDADPVLTLDESFLAANAWLADGTPYQLVKSTAVGERKIADTPASLLNASVHPNPTAGPATLQLTSPEAGKMRLTLMNAYGQRVALRDVSVVKGTQTVPLNEAANLPAGIYQWWIRTPDGSSAQGQLIVK